MPKKQYFDTFVDVFGEENYSPMSSKILGILFTSNQQYFTFYELMDILNASKSAVSKSLKFLMEQGDVNFIFESGSSRKRMFYLDAEGSINRLNRIIDSKKVFNNLLKEIIAFRNDENKKVNNFIRTLIQFNDEMLGTIEANLNSLLNRDTVHKP